MRALCSRHGGIQKEHLGKERRVSLDFAWGFIEGSDPCTYFLRHPRTKMSVKVTSISHLSPGSRGLGESMVLENIPTTVPGHSLDVIYHARRLQRNH